MARILVADDNAALLAAVGHYLRDAGHLVTSTNNGADALCLLSSKPPPDLFIIDIQMPGLDGYEVLKQLGPTAPPVVVISGGKVDENKFESSKVSRVLLKPFNASEMMEVVNSALDGKGKELPAPTLPSDGSSTTTTGTVSLEPVAPVVPEVPNAPPN